MMSRGKKPDPTSVFLNVPYDGRYERVFVTLVTALVAVGRVPRCVLEISDEGEGRLKRIIKLIGECSLSIHDLSRTQARFNMPFELGLACALSQLGYVKGFILFETRPQQLPRQLSDLGAVDPHIHRGTVHGMISCVSNAFGSQSVPLDFKLVRRLDQRVWQFAKRIKTERKLPNLFDRTAFFEMVKFARQHAQQDNIIK